MTAYTVTTDTTVATGTATGETITAMTDDSAVFDGAELYFQFVDGTVTHSLSKNPSGKGCLSSPGNTQVAPPTGCTWKLISAGSGANTNIKVSVI